MKLFKYGDFITESVLYSLLEANIIFSKDFTNIINKIDSPISKKIIDVDTEGEINSSIFNITNNSQNPSVIANYELDLIDDAQDYLTSLINVTIPSNVKKLNAILDPDSIQGITEEARRAIFQQRNTLSNLINSIANVPIIFSEFITD